MEPEHLLSVRVSDVRSPAAIGLNGAEVVVAVADGRKNIHLHRLFNAGLEVSRVRVAVELPCTVP